MAQVLVTGGSGLIGWRAVEKLLKEGHSVIVYDLVPNHDNLAGLGAELVVETGDIMDLPRLLTVMKKYDVDRVLHLAAFIAHQSIGSPVASYEVNIKGTANVLDAAVALDVQRVCWASSVNAVGIPPDYDGAAVTEDVRVSPVTAYGAAKYCCEIMARTYRDERGLDVVGIRPPLAYGLGRLTGGTGMFNDAVRRVAVGEPATVLGFSAAPHQPVYNRDMAAFFVHTLLIEGEVSDLYNTPALGEHTPEEIAATLRKLRPGAAVAVDWYPAFAATPPVMDGSRARAELGFAPQYTLEQGLAEMLDFYSTEADSRKMQSKS